MSSSPHFNIPEGATQIHLLPAQTVPEALAASFLGMGFKALSVFILELIAFIILIGLFFGFVNLAGQQGDFKNVMESLTPYLPQDAHISKDDFVGVLPTLFVGFFTVLFLPVCCDFVMFHLKRKEEREGMKDEFVRRLRKNSLLIGMVFIFAIAMTPLARYAEGTTALSMSGTLAGFCLAALIANLFFVAFDTFANQLLWHAGLMFYNKFF